MALVQKKMSKSKMTILVAVLVIFLGISGYFIYDGYFRKSDEVEPTTNAGVQGTDLPIVQDLGTDVLQDERYQELVPHGNLPVQPGSSGRTNPFEFTTQ